MKTILITGGAGYIGSHIGYACAQAGYRVLLLDTLRYQQPFNYPWATCIVGNCADQQLVHTILHQEGVWAVIHCAARIEVGLSASEPLLFYQENISALASLLQSMVNSKVSKIIFSSSAAVYGIPHSTPIPEEHPCQPINTYGFTKMVGEQLLQAVYDAHGIASVSFRFFNVAGAQPEEGLREYHVPETHLIPLLITARRHKKPFYIFGTDYKTPDGTCLRDYVHVKDIAQAHVFALEYLQQETKPLVFNLGSGRGTSVREIIEQYQKMSRLQVNVVMGARRAGDPAALVADISKATQILGWTPRFSSLELLLGSAMKE